jgi:hypothetical protein
MTNTEKAAAFTRWSQRFSQAAEDCRLGKEVRFVVSAEDYDAIKDLPLSVSGEEDISAFLQSITDDDLHLSPETPPSSVLRGGRPRFYR